jgi:hypothetical protein
MAIVDFTMFIEYLSKPPPSILLGFSWRNPLRMLLKMCSIDLLDKSGIQSILKCLNKRGVTGFLPPEGGAQTFKNMQSLI